MKYRKLDINGDYSFGSGMKDYISESEAVAQAIKTKILLFYEEWWEDKGIGIPMFQSFVGQTNPETIKTSLADIIEKRIKDVPGINQVKNVEVEIDKTNRTIGFEIDVVTLEDNLVTVEVSL